jgi:hypothetical protein
MYRRLVTPLLAIRSCSVVYVVDNVVSVAVILTFLLLGLADRAK